MAGKFEVYQDSAGKFRFRLKAGNGEVVATGQGTRACRAPRTAARPSSGPLTVPVWSRWTARRPELRAGRACGDHSRASGCGFDRFDQRWCGVRAGAARPLGASGLTLFRPGA